MTGIKKWVFSMRLAIEAALMEVRTTTLGRIESYSSSDQRATALPLLQRRSADGTRIDPQPIANTLVLHPSAGGFSIVFPVKSGDKGLLLCSDRSTDSWMGGSGGPADPNSSLTHQLNDSVFLPGMHTWSDPITVGDPDDLVIAKDDGSVQLRITSGSKVKVRGAVDNTSEAIVDGSVTSLHASFNSSLTEISAVLAGLGIPAPNTAALVALLAAGTWKSPKLEA